MARARATITDEDLAKAALPPLPRTAWLAVDLDRLASNMRAIRDGLPPGVRVEPAVKADAYGHGAVPVAWALQRAGADGLCVATWDEALELRDASIRLPILVLFPSPPGFAPEARACLKSASAAAGWPPIVARLYARRPH